MLYYKKIMLALTSCIVAASCSNVDERMSSVLAENNVRFTASMNTVTRATETEFEEGDQIAVYAVQEGEDGNTVLNSSGNYADGVTYTYTGGKFTNAKGIVRPANFGVRYFAIYPHTAGAEVPTSKFQVKTNQHEAGQYTLSDLCTAVSDVTKDKEVDLVFSHRLSHVVINLEGEILGTGHPVVSLTNVNTACDVNFNANSYVEADGQEVVRCADNGTNSYKAIIVPQTIKAGDPFISVVLNGKEHLLKAATDIVFVSGKQRTFNLTVDDGEIVSYTSNIQPWDEENRYLEIVPEALDLGTEESATLSILSHNGSTVYELYTEGESSWAKLDREVGIITQYDPTDASTVETITVTANRTGLVPGEYNFTLIVRSDLGDTRVPVSMTVEKRGGEDAEIISCDENLVFTLSSCTISGATATLDMTVKNVGNEAISLQVYGGYSGYAYDDQGNKYTDTNMKVSIAGSYYDASYSRTDIPAGIMTKLSIKIYNVSEQGSVFNYMKLPTTLESSLILKNIAIEGRTNVALEGAQTTGTVETCNENLNFTLLDCKYGSNYTELRFRVKNTGGNTVSLQLYGGYSGYAYDDQGNKYANTNMKVSIAGSNYDASYSKTEIPAGIMTNGSIRFYNVDTNATEFSNITLKTNQEGSLEFKNVKIRK